MSDKKHIDRLFQEGFKDFEAKPSDAVWNNIESRLNEKNKKRRIIPIWWRYAGVAALLLMFLSLGGLFLNTENDSLNPIVDTKDHIENNLKTNENSPLDSTENNQNIAVENSNSAPTQNVNQNKPGVNAVQSVSSYSSNASSSVAAATTSTRKSKYKPSLASENNINTNSYHPSENVAFTYPYEEKNILPKNSKSNNTVVAYNDKNENTNSPELDKNQAKISISNASEETNTQIAQTEKQTTEEQIAENGNQEKALSIEEALENNKDLLKEEIDNKQNRWSIAPNAAPVYFNSLGEGSSIDPQFSSNSKTGEVNMSYGISASYAINDKIKIRSGVNKVNLGYNTNDIIIYQSVGVSSNSNALQNINSGNSGYSVVSTESFDARDLPQTLLTSNTTINQAFGYIEVPLEIQYTLSAKKFGVNLIGGFSSFFLDNNEVYSKAENGPRVFLGEANNINKISYSANFGLGLNYEVSKTFDLNLEPMFKYQFNTFNNTSGNFTPFFIGVYTGVAIKF